MKNLYVSTVLITLLMSGRAFSQSLVPTQQGDPPVSQFKAGKQFPLVTFSVSIPLLKRYKLSKQQQKVAKLPKAPIILNDEDGPIAFEATGETINIVIPRWTSPPPITYFDMVWQIDPNQSGGGTEVPPPANDIYYEEPPKPLKNARKVAKNYCKDGKNVFKNMYDAQLSRGKEQAAFITDNGIYWLNDSENTLIKYETGLPYEYSKGSDGKYWFLDGGQVVTILGIVHTHPPGPGYYGMSSADVTNGQDFNVPNYAISDEGVWRVNPNGSPSIVDNNYNDAFDCGIAYGLFGL